MKMYTNTARRKKTSARNRVLALGLLVAVTLLWAFWPGGASEQTEPKDELQAELRHETQQPRANSLQHRSGSVATPAKIAARQAKKPPTKPVKIARQASGAVVGPAGMTEALARQIGPSPITVRKIPKAQALRNFERGLELFAANKDLLQARALLNSAYISGTLAQTQAGRARKTLENIAERTVLAADPYVNPKDPYMMSYTFAPGDMLNSRWRSGKLLRAGVIAKCDLNVPADILLRVNGLASARAFRAGRSYKLLKGPFHLMVYKDKFAADIYLQDLFVRRIPICIGEPETPTPVGYFRLASGGKTINSPYNAPAEAGGASHTLLPGQDGYPLDRQGHNMKIEGIAQLGTNILVSQSYAIHGTNEPDSIGTAASRGCLRAGDQNIRMLFGILQTYANPNNPRVTWKRWSTVTVE